MAGKFNIGRRLNGTTDGMRFEALGSVSRNVNTTNSLSWFWEWKVPTDATTGATIWYPLPAGTANKTWAFALSGSDGAWDVTYYHHYSTGSVESHTFSLGLSSDVRYYVGFTRVQGSNVLKPYVYDLDGDAWVINDSSALSWTFTNPPTTSTSSFAMYFGGPANGTDGIGDNYLKADLYCAGMINYLTREMSEAEHLYMATERNAYPEAATNFYSEFRWYQSALDSPVPACATTKEFGPDLWQDTTLYTGFTAYKFTTNGTPICSDEAPPHLFCDGGCNCGATTTTANSYSPYRR